MRHKDPRIQLMVSLVLVTTSGAIFAVPSVPATGSSGLGLVLEEVCSPQLAECLDPGQPCAGVSQPGSSIGLGIQVTDGDEATDDGEIGYQKVNVSDGSDHRTVWTDETGHARISLQPSDAWTLSVEHDGTQATLEPELFWGQVSLNGPVPVDARSGTPLDRALDVALTGQGVPPEAPGTVTVRSSRGEHLSGPIEHGGGELEISDQGLGTVDYEVVDAELCGLELADPAGFQIHWYPTALELSPATLSLTAGQEDLPDISVEGLAADGSTMQLDPGVLSWTWKEPDGETRDLEVGQEGQPALPIERTGSFHLSTTLDQDTGIGARIPVDIAPGPLAEIAVDCPSDALGGQKFNCTANTLDRFGNLREDPIDAWSIQPGTLVGASGQTASFDAPPHGGHLQVEAAIDELTGQASVTATDGAGPDLKVSPPGSPTEDRQTRFRVEATDPSGLASITLTTDSTVAGERTWEEPPLQITTSLEHTFPNPGTFNVTIVATDDANQASIWETEITVHRRVPMSFSSRDTPSGELDGRDTPGDQRSPEPVTAGAEQGDDGEAIYRATVPVVDDLTAPVRTSDGTYEISLRAQQTQEVDISFRPTAPDDGQPPPIFPSLSTVDITAHGPDGDPAKISGGSLEVQLPPERLEKHGVDPGDVVIYHWDGEIWERLPTEHLASEDGGAAFRAPIDSLSPFAALDTGRRAADGSATASVVEVTATHEAGSSPATYVAETDASADQDLLVRTADGRAVLDIALAEPGTYTVELDIGDHAPLQHAPWPTATGQLVDVRVLDGAGRPIEDPEVQVHLLVDEERVEDAGGTVSNLVATRSAEDRWEPIPTLVEVAATGYKARFSPSSGAHALLLDTTPPEIGLTSQPPDDLSEPRTFTVVARDNVGIDRIEVQAGGQTIATLTDRPFDVTLSPSDVPQGSETLTFVALDVAGNQETSKWHITGDQETDGPLDQNARGDHQQEATAREGTETTELTSVPAVLALIGFVLACTFRRR